MSELVLCQNMEGVSEHTVTPGADLWRQCGLVRLAKMRIINLNPSKKTF